MGRKHGGPSFSLLDGGNDSAGRRRCLTSGALGILGVLLIAAAFHPVLQATVLQWVRYLIIADTMAHRVCCWLCVSGNLHTS